MSVPATISIPLTPVCMPMTGFDTPLEKIRVEGMTSGPLTIAGCMKNRQDLSEEFRLRHDSGDRSAIARLVQINPEFVSEPWVRKAFMELGERAVLSHEGPGRPWGRSSATDVRRLLLTGLIDAMHETTGRSHQSIFQSLADQGRLRIGFSRIRDIYYEEKKAGRRSACLFVRE